MPRIVEYPVVLDRMRQETFRCLYHNSGAFGFPPEPPVHTFAWIGPEDPSLRASAKPFTSPIDPPYIPNLMRFFSAAWRDHLRGNLWLMPMSHWAFELGHNHAPWLADALRTIDVDPTGLESLNNAAAIEFPPEEEADFTMLAGVLLANLRGSDYMIAFPAKPALCMLHHHQQLWWTTPDANLIAALRQIA